MPIHWQELESQQEDVAADEIHWTDLTAPRTLTEAYAGLGVAPGTPWEEVRSAFRHRVRTIHPDHAPEHKRQDAEEQMKVLNLCYRMVSEHIGRD